MSHGGDTTDRSLNAYKSMKSRREKFPYSGLADKIQQMATGILAFMDVECQKAGCFSHPLITNKKKACMSKLDEIHRLFKLASVPLKDSDSLAIEKLADLLEEQEEISHAAQGRHEGASGVLITTQSRLLFAGLPKGKKSKSDLKVVGIPYERVEAVEYGDNRGTGVLFIVSSGIKSEFSCDAKQVRVIAEHIHAGAPSPAPLTAGKRPSTPPAVKAIAIVLIALVGINLLSAMFGGDKTETPKKQEPVKQQIAKKDGTYDERENDLDELCKDWVYLKAKTYKYGREGNVEEAQKARESFQRTNVWLSEYRDEDVARVCQQYDTKENLINYMR